MTDGFRGLLAFASPIVMGLTGANELPHRKRAEMIYGNAILCCPTKQSTSSEAGKRKEKEVNRPTKMFPMLDRNNASERKN